VAIAGKKMVIQNGNQKNNERYYMLNSSKTSKWLIDNAPYYVINDLRALNKAMVLQINNTLSNMNMIEDIEKNINSPHKIQAIINKYKIELNRFSDKLDDLNIAEIKIDNDIMEMLNSVLSKSK